MDVGCFVPLTGEGFSDDGRKLFVPLKAEEFSDDGTKLYLPCASLRLPAYWFAGQSRNTSTNNLRDLATYDGLINPGT